MSSSNQRLPHARVVQGNGPFARRRGPVHCMLYQKVHKVYRAEEVEEEKKEEKPEAKSRPKLEEFIMPIESNVRSAMMPVRV